MTCKWYSHGYGCLPGVCKAPPQSVIRPNKRLGKSWARYIIIKGVKK